MPLIDVANAQSGMVLSADVRDRRGRVLIPSGKELKERYLSALPMWGITHVEIEGDDPSAPDEELDEATLEQASREVGQRFEHANRAHPAIDALLSVCVRRRAEELQRQTAVVE